ncbi:unnamed protein product [Clonostachys chloroleuca]|uniref:Zn(2)-C6 fungal-type domain-containing protein n=1 Tax=Clonostachys chloroleuca TaxID=1926264 RepID=A0AA35Q7C6_9HYPO|nr:unnamed protein product [Clonostachys chloroleuca]
MVSRKPGTPKKLPACDPCRAAKLACDHSRPVCTRCRDSNRTTECTYRLLPFKKKRPLGEEEGPPNKRTQQESPQSTARAVESDLPVDPMITKAHKYPNPGYLGSFSHTTLFNNLPGRNHNVSLGVDGPSYDQNQPRPIAAAPESNIARGASLLEQLGRTFSLSLCEKLVRRWLSKGSNLALAGVFTDDCAKTIQHIFPEGNGGHAPDFMAMSKSLFLHTSRPLRVGSDTALQGFTSQFSHNNARWETLGLFFAAVSRSTVDISSIESFFESEKERRDLQRLSMTFADSCLDIAISLDCLNDLQLFLQYENFISHSFVDGDQSYHTWKALGDVISSLFALGYHQQLEGNSPATPAFLAELRGAYFARAYSADKNISIFLGRPPRIHRRYCRFRLPGFGDHQWKMDLPFDYLVDTQWSALCAILKEEILDLFEADDNPGRAHRASLLETRAKEQWSALPEHFRLETPLRLCNREPIIRDFMVSARLNHLHILFLLRLALSRQAPDSDKELVSISVEILGLVVDAIIQKDQLVNSGTSLVWKIAYYGLSAAGVICLWLLNRMSTTRHNTQINISKAVQHLGVLVTEMETGILVRTDDPNYRLLASASQTIDSLISRLLMGGIPSQPTIPPAARFVSSILNSQEQETWNSWESHSLQDFEVDFWGNLAEHPFLTNPETIP